MSRYRDIARQIVGLIEQRMRQANPDIEGIAAKTEGNRLLRAQDYHQLEAELAEILSQVTSLKHNCINCEYFVGDDWTCDDQQGRQIDDPFKERAECKAWEPARTSLGIARSFPPCTPEYDSLDRIP